MVELPLTQGRVAFLSDEDGDLLARRWCVCNGYPAFGTWKPRGVVYLHRLIAERLGIIGEIDHIDRNKFNAQRGNLRRATRSQNCGNVGPRGVSGLVGVHRHRSGWAVDLKREGIRYRRAGFMTPEDAAAWRAEKLIEIGSF